MQDRIFSFLDCGNSASQDKTNIKELWCRDKRLKQIIPILNPDIETERSNRMKNSVFIKISSKDISETKTCEHQS